MRMILIAVAMAVTTQASAADMTHQACISAMSNIYDANTNAMASVVAGLKLAGTDSLARAALPNLAAQAKEVMAGYEKLALTYSDLCEEIRQRK